MNIYEMYGRLAEQKASADDWVERTLSLLASLRDGEVDPSRLSVDSDGWTVRNEDEASEDAE